MEIINMLPGGVFIIAKERDEILFKNEQIGALDWVSASGLHINANFRFKIVPIVKISENKKDAVRLYENDVDEEEIVRDTGENQRIVNFFGVLQEAATSGGTVNVFRVDNEQYLSIRVKDIHFNGVEARLVFLQDIT